MERLSELPKKNTGNDEHEEHDDLNAIDENSNHDGNTEEHDDPNAIDESSNQDGNTDDDTDDDDEDYADDDDESYSNPEFFKGENSLNIYEDLGYFDQQYCCFPLSHIDKSHLEYGNKIIMPLSAFDRLASIKIEYPMLFEIKNPYTDQGSHCGVLEFSADEGFAFLPNWMMKNLQLHEGQLVNLKSTSLPKGTYMKIRPHDKEFLGLRDPKSVLEKALRDFSCLTIGDTIVLNHDNNPYYVDILETKPSSGISVIETDCEVDFAPFLDDREPEKKAEAAIKSKRELADKVEEEKGKEEPKFIPFTGTAKRLDGKACLPTSVAKEDRVAVADDLSLGSRRHKQKVVFGSEEDVKVKVVEKEDQKFQPFTGKKYALAG